MLEEFFKCPPADEENRLEVEFQDLEYELKRQASDSGNSYVGQRLAKGRQDQNSQEHSGSLCVRVESPRKLNSGNSLIGLQVRIKFLFGVNLMDDLSNVYGAKRY